MSSRRSACLHESIGKAQDGSDVVVCWDCDEQYTPESQLRAKLEEMTLHDDTGDQLDEGYMMAVREIRRHFLGDDDHAV